ncbi:MAG TPA: hypothetical protein VGI79_16130 [Caulobacteraceae bacterium]
MRQGTGAKIAFSTPTNARPVLLRRRSASILIQLAVTTTLAPPALSLRP